MKRLFHWSFDPAGRLVRLALFEKEEAAEYVTIAPWETSREIARLAPGATTPALIDTGSEGRVIVMGTQAICEHLEDTCAGRRLLPAGLADRAEARRLWRYCEDGFAEVNATLLAERVGLAVRRNRAPDSAALRRGAHALRGRLTFLNALVEIRGNLAGRALTLADMCAAAHLSCYDYFGDLEWDSVPDLKDWYARIKSRPSFRALLEERLDSTRPSAHYADLDF